MKKKNYRDHFEDLYLRHDYFKKAKNLDPACCVEFKHIIEITSNIMFKKNAGVFNKVSFTIEDITNIANVYAILYMNLYSLKANPKDLDKFKKTFEKKKGFIPKDSDVYTHERNCMINFIRQGITHCATVCNRKSKNIVADADKTLLFAFTEDSTKASETEIFDNYAKYGYRKVTKAEFKKSQDRARELNETVMVDDEGYKVFAVEKKSTGISANNYYDVITKAPSSMKDPEQILEEKEELEAIDSYKERFNNLDDSKKALRLRRFIEKHKDSAHFSNQVSLARKMLKNRDFMV